MFFSSSVVNPVSFLSCSTQVSAGLPCSLLQFPKKHLTYCSLLSPPHVPYEFQPLSCSTEVKLLSSPYSSLFVLRSLEIKPRTARSIRIYVPSSLLFMAFVCVHHVHDHVNRTISTVQVRFPYLHTESKA